MSGQTECETGPAPASVAGQECETNDGRDSGDGGRLELWTDKQSQANAVRAGRAQEHERHGPGNQWCTIQLAGDGPYSQSEHQRLYYRADHKSEFRDSSARERRHQCVEHYVRMLHSGDKPVGRQEFGIRRMQSGQQIDEVIGFARGDADRGHEHGREHCDQGKIAPIHEWLFCHRWNLRSGPQA